MADLLNWRDLSTLIAALALLAATMLALVVLPMAFPGDERIALLISSIVALGGAMAARIHLVGRQRVAVATIK